MQDRASAAAPSFHPVTICAGAHALSPLHVAHPQLPLRPGCHRQHADRAGAGCAADDAGGLPLSQQLGKPWLSTHALFHPHCKQDCLVGISHCLPVCRCLSLVLCVAKAYQKQWQQ